MKWYGWAGVAIMAAGEALLFLGNDFATTWFTPIMWTGYILAGDAVASRRLGDSRIFTRPREFGMMAVLSVASWLIFEVYNFKLRNWIYLGLPEAMVLRDLGFLWAFATITPAIFVSADLLAAFGVFQKSLGRPGAFQPSTLAAMFILGAALLIVPPSLPDRPASFSFAAVWVGFVLLLEPVNYRLGLPSFLRDWETGWLGRTYRFLLAGLLCGFLWEAWNYQAFLREGGIWIYTIPQELRVLNLHYGQMPVLGLLGFPPFALECFSIYYFLRWALRGDVLLEPVRD